MTHHLSAETATCVNECLHCYSVCLGTAMHHCLEPAASISHRRTSG